MLEEIPRIWGEAWGELMSGSLDIFRYNVLLMADGRFYGFPGFLWSVFRSYAFTSGSLDISCVHSMPVPVFPFDQPDYCGSGG